MQHPSITYLLMSIGVLFATPVFAADWQMNAQPVEGQEHVVALHIALNAGDETFNVVEGTISLAGQDLRVMETAIGNSVATFWTERPTLHGNDVHFSFMTPGGITGNDLPVLSVIASVSPDSTLTVSTHDSAAYLHNGEGTKVVLPDTSLAMTTPALTVKPIAITDNQSPEPFTPIVSEESLISPEPTILFQAQDKESGIDHYEFFASSQPLADEELAQIKDWTRIESPYSLPEHIVAAHVYVKAVDKGGNTRIAHLELKAPAPYHWPFSLAIVILTLLAAFVALSKQTKPTPRRKRKHLRK